MLLLLGALLKIGLHILQITHKALNINRIKILLQMLDLLLEFCTTSLNLLQLRTTLLYGDFHRLLSPYEGNDTAWITVSKDKSEAVFMLTRALAKSGTAPILVKLRGLDENKVYTVLETGESYSGSELMNLGVSVRLPWGDAASVSWTLKV
jgi:hypothetical protein